MEDDAGTAPLDQHLNLVFLLDPLKVTTTTFVEQIKGDIFAALDGGMW